MWNTDSFWFEFSIISFCLMIGHIFMGHFEERSSKLRKFVKAIVSILLMITLSYFIGRAVAFTVFALFLIPIIYVHAIWLPRKGINGWTGEPKSKYYELRGWSKDIF